jgi:menaquinone-dependent protoporphyrinogen oxidase
MASILVAYGTGEGQTATVASRIADALTEHGHTTDLVDVDDRPDGVDPAVYDAALIGASIHMGAHQQAVTSFLTAHRAELATMPSGVFQLSLSAAIDDDAHRAETMGYVDDLIETTGWHPDRIAVFGGALRYSEYGFITRSLMKSIAKRATGDTDTSRDYEYTDWDEVDRFADEFAGFVDDQLAVRSKAIPEQ